MHSPALLARPGWAAEGGGARGRAARGSKAGRGAEGGKWLAGAPCPTWPPERTGAPACLHRLCTPLTLGRPTLECLWAGENGRAAGTPAPPAPPLQLLTLGEQVFQGEALTWTGQGQLEARRRRPGAGLVVAAATAWPDRASPLESDASG